MSLEETKEKESGGDIISPKWVLIGAGVAILMVMLVPSWYDAVMHFELFTLPDWLGGKRVNLHFTANDLLLPLFFAIAAKEVRESFIRDKEVDGEIVPGGAMGSWSRAALPGVGTLGGVLVPALMFVALSHYFSPDIMRGGLIPTATDIVFAIMIAKLVGWDMSHPAVTLLLTIAVIDDGIGLVLIPLVYSDDMNWGMFGLVLMLTVGMAVLFRGLGVKKWYWYIGVIGGLTWLGFLWLGVEPAMALVPVVLAMPYARSDLGLFSSEEPFRHDALSEMEHFIAKFLSFILLIFAFANAGISMTAPDSTAWIVLVSLIVGKFVGIFAFAYIGLLCGLKLPDGMSLKELPVVAAIAGVGFTVAVFVAGVAFEGSPAVAEQAKMGALLSLPVGLVVAFVLATVLGVRRRSVE